MSTTKRRNYTPQGKVEILRKHILEGMAVSDVCDGYGLNPNFLFRWQKEFFENGAAAFAGHAPMEKRRRNGISPRS
jgi:transposase